MAKEIITCECGAVYERTEIKIIFRDKDSQDCGNCGIQLERWNGSRLPMFTLISKPEKATDG